MDDQIETPAAPAVKKNRGGRPRKNPAPIAASGPSFSDEQFQQLIAVLAAKPPSENGGSAGFDIQALKEVLATTSLDTANAMRRAMKPENQEHPGISAFSHPEGDVKNPRATLGYELFWNGYPVHQFPETQHWRELELMTKLEPGEFTVLRKDGSPMAVTVIGDRDANLAVKKVTVTFPIAREDKWLVPPMSVVLYQLVSKESPKRRFVAAMQEHLQIVMGDEELATA